MGGAHPPAGTNQVPGQSPPCVGELCTTLRGTREGTVEDSRMQVEATGGVPRATRCIQRVTVGGGGGGGSLRVCEGPLGVCRDYCGVPGATECVQGTTGVSGGHWVCVKGHWGYAGTTVGCTKEYLRVCWVLLGICRGPLSVCRGLQGWVLCGG